MMMKKKNRNEKQTVMLSEQNRRSGKATKDVSTEYRRDDDTKLVLATFG